MHTYLWDGNSTTIGNSSCEKLSTLCLDTASVLTLCLSTLRLSALIVSRHCVSKLSKLTRHCNKCIRFFTLDSCQSSLDTVLNASDFLDSRHCIHYTRIYKSDQCHSMSRVQWVSCLMKALNTELTSLEWLMLLWLLHKNLDTELTAKDSQHSAHGTRISTLAAVFIARNSRPALSSFHKTFHTCARCTIPSTLQWFFKLQWVNHARVFGLRRRTTSAVQSLDFKTRFELSRSIPVSRSTFSTPCARPAESFQPCGTVPWPCKMKTKIVGMAVTLHTHIYTYIYIYVYIYVYDDDDDDDDVYANSTASVTTMSCKGRWLKMRT